MTNKDKVFLITGAARGIGAAAVRRLIGDGAKVIAHYNSSENEAAALVKECGPENLKTLRANLENDAEIDALWDQALGWQGRLDGLVNNAALMVSSTPEAPEDQWREDWRRTLKVNTQAVADLSRHAILYFKDRGQGGAIVNIASRAGFRGDAPDSMHYAASKGAVIALTRSIAKGYAKHGILAYTVAPGWVATERVLPKLTKPGNEFLLGEIPMGEAAPPEEVANIIAFLLSGQARHATGATFDINGASYFH